MLKPNERLRQARIASGKTEQDVAAAGGVNKATYYDLEAYPDDICMTLSLDELLKISTFIGVNPVDIVGDVPPHEVEVTCEIDFREFREIIQEFLNRRKMTLEQLEAVAGWTLSDFMEDPDVVWSWNADGLRFVAGACGINWLAVLPRNSQ